MKHSMEQELKARSAVLERNAPARATWRYKYEALSHVAATAV